VIYSNGMRTRAKAVLVIAILSFALAACSGNNNIIKDVGTLSRSSDGLTPPQAKQLERLKRYAKMRVQGTAGGAVVGALTCGLLSGGKNVARNAAACGIAGGFAGYLVGAYYANINAVAEDKRDTLEAKLAAARAAVEETRQAGQDRWSSPLKVVHQLG
jgi:hypothetical protein